MSEDAINKKIVKAMESINKAIDYLEDCVEEDYEDTDDLTDIADSLAELCDQLAAR